VAGRPDALRVTAFSIFTKIRKEIPEPALPRTDAPPDETVGYRLRPGEPERLHVPLFVLAPRSFELRWFKTDDRGAMVVGGAAGDTEVDRDPAARRLPFATKRHARLCRPPPARILHVAYTLSPGARWAAVVWTDTDGVMLETSAFRVRSGGRDLDSTPQPTNAGTAATPIDGGGGVLTAEDAETLARELWARTTTLVEATMLPWRVVVCALGGVSTGVVDSIARVASTVVLTGLREDGGGGGGSFSPDAAERDTAGAVLGFTIVALDECHELQIFHSEVPEGIASATGSASPCLSTRSRALVQPEAFAPTCFRRGAAPTLATVLINTNHPGGLLRSGHPWPVPGDRPRSCTVMLKVLHHAPQPTDPKDRNVYPLDSRCLRSVGRFVAEQLHGLSWLSVACIPNVGRTSCLPFHIAVLQRLGRQLEDFFM